MFNIPIPDDMPTLIDGMLTFIGAVITYWPELSRYWNPDTQETYFRYYVELIAPHLKARPLAEYDDVTYFESIITFLKEDGTRRNKDKQYSESTLHHFRYLIKKVITIASKNNVCTDVLWGTEFDQNEEICLEEIQAKIRTAVRKSFTVLQEFRIADVVFIDPLADGLYIAFLIMWIFGLRNKEVCGLIWGDIKPMPEHPGHYILAVYSSTSGNTTARHAYGKTSNMYRLLPIPALVYDFLIRRKAHIQALIDSGIIILEDGCTIDQLPIACNGTKWTMRCYSNKITVAGRQFFKDIGITEEQWKSAQFEPDISDKLDRIAWDKDPTVYTFRRNLATHLYLLGLEIEEIQYFMGHDIDNPLFPRSTYSNPDKMNILFCKISQRPIVNNINLDIEQVDVTSFFHQENASQLKTSLKEPGKYIIRVTPNVSHKDFTISLKKTSTENESTVPCSYRQTVSHVPMQEEVSVLFFYQERYRREYRRRKKKSEGTENAE